jgi:predicted enzyme related to lactoylglutathione lyase
MKNGAICYIEFFTTDLEKSRAFYETVFGWSFEAREGWQDFLFFSPAEGIGGMFKRKPEGIGPRGPIVHMTCSDVDRVLRAVEHAGGRVIIPTTPKSSTTPDAGVFALVEDNVGNRLGLST